MALFERHPEAAGLRWWSTFEASWPNVTLWDRAASRMYVEHVEPLDLDSGALVEAARFLGLALRR